MHRMRHRVNGTAQFGVWYSGPDCPNQGVMGTLCRDRGGLRGEYRTPPKDPICMTNLILKALFLEALTDP